MQFEHLVDRQEIWSSVEKYLIFLRSMKAYDLAAQYATNKTVLDFGCGAGYGAYYIAQVAASVSAVDVDPKVINYAADKYKADNLKFNVIDEKLRPRSTKFDVITCFQVIEHIPDSEIGMFFEQIKRSMGEGGIALFSTPNKRIRLLPFQRPWHPDHKKEYTTGELHKLVSQHFKSVVVGGITSRHDIIRLEKRRVRRAALAVLARRILSGKTYDRLRSLKNTTSEAGVKNWSQSYSLADFVFRLSLPDKEVLDIVAIAKS